MALALLIKSWGEGSPQTPSLQTWFSRCLGLSLELSRPVLVSLGTLGGSLETALLGLPLAFLGHFWLHSASLGSVLASLGRPLGLSWPPFSLPFWAPRAKKRQGSNKVLQDRPKSRPRSSRGSQNGPPKTELFVSFSGSVFGPPLGLPFGCFLGRLAPKKQTFRLGGPSKRCLPQVTPKSEKKRKKSRN